MADSSIPATPGPGPGIHTWQNAGTLHDQFIRAAPATGETDNSWTVSTTASTSQIPADASRVGVLIVSQASGRVYLRFDSTAPTSTAFHYYLDPGDRWEVPTWLSTLAISMVGAIAGGTILTHLATAA